MDVYITTFSFGRCFKAATGADSPCSFSCMSATHSELSLLAQDVMQQKAHLQHWPESVQRRSCFIPLEPRSPRRHSRAVVIVAHYILLMLSITLIADDRYSQWGSTEWCSNSWSVVVFFNVVSRSLHTRLTSSEMPSKKKTKNFWHPTYPPTWCRNPLSHCV